MLSDTAGRAHRMVAAADAGAGAAAGSKAPTPVYIFSSREDVAGEVKINVFGGKRLDHGGIRIELKGVVGACRLERDSSCVGRAAPPLPLPPHRGCCATAGTPSRPAQGAGSP